MDNFKETNNKITHTLSEDMGFAIRENKDGFVKDMIHAEERKDLEKKQREIYNRRNRIYLMISIFFVILSLGALLFVFFKEEAETFLFKRKTSPLIFHETTKVIDITNQNKDQINALVLENVNQNERKAGLLEGLYFVNDKKTVNFSNFLASVNSVFVPKEDSFDQNFFIGIMNFDETVGNPIDFPDRTIPNTNNNTNNQNTNTQNEASFKEGEILDDFIILSDINFFKTGTLTFKDEDSLKMAKELISYLVDLIPFEDHKIQVFGIYANELNSNQNLAENRKQIGLNLLNEVLKSKYDENKIKELTIESATRGISLSDIYTQQEINQMSLEQKATNIELNNGIKFKIEPKELSQVNNPNAGENITVVLENQIKEKTPVFSNFKKDTDLFILLRTSSFASSFEQIKSWENKMFLDLHGFFGYDVSLFTNYLLTKDFKDGFIENKNARILYDDTGKIVMMYVYIDDNFVVITNTEQAVREAILRVNSSKIKK